MIGRPSRKVGVMAGVGITGEMRVLPSLYARHRARLREAHLLRLRRALPRLRLRQSAGANHRIGRMALLGVGLLLMALVTSVDGLPQPSPAHRAPLAGRGG